MRVDLSGKVAFVTGSTGGIGKVIAIKLAENGADIVLNGRVPASATKVIRQVEELGRRAVFEQADITDYGQVKHAVGDALSKMSRLDVLIVSGGLVGASPRHDFFHLIDPAAYSDFVITQWFSRLYCIRAVLDHMIEQRQGKIVTITTDAGRWPTPAECLPGGTGAAVVMTTKVLAQELARWQVRINTISLPPIPNTVGYEYTAGLSDSLARMFKKALSRQPFPVTAEDVAKAVLFLSSDESNAITGQILSINGGLCFPG